MAQTPTAELIGYKLGVTDTLDWIEQQRAQGWSYGRIAAEVYRATGTYVTAQTIRTWLIEAERAAS